MKNCDTLAAIVTYNRCELLQKCIGRILAQDADCDVLIVDNNSTDGTAEMVSREFGENDRVSYFCTGDNLGGAGGFHLGLHDAVSRGYKYAWLMDDDSMPEPDALSELLRAGDLLGDWGFLSSAVYWTDGKPCLANRPKRDLFRHVDSAWYEQDNPKPVFMGSFVSMLVPTDVVREVGLPVAEYFIWTDDYEFSGRISKKRQGWFVPKSKVVHEMANNTRADLVTAEGERAGRFRMLYRNDVHCYRQHGLLGLAYLAAKGGYTAADVLLHAKDHKRERLGAMVTGFSEGVRFHPSPVLPAAQHKKQVLYYTDGWGRGGIETFVMNVLTHMDMTKYDVTIFSPWDSGEHCFESELRELGVRRVSLQSAERPSNLKRGVFDLKPFKEMFDFGNVDVFHAHTTTVVGLAYCAVAKANGVKKVIAHSHASSYGSGGEMLKSAMHRFGLTFLADYPDIRVACSDDAGRYLFGGRSFSIVNNGIDTKRFAFDEAVRNNVRRELGVGIDDCLVGNVGRIADEKNPLFMAEVFASFLKIRPDAKFLMVGSGPIELELDEAIRRLGLSEAIIRMPSTAEPERYYSALDAFLFPSKFEGLGITAIEAQCSGLPVLVAAHLPHEVAVTDLVVFEDLSAGASAWADQLAKMLNNSGNRFEYAGVLEHEGWTASRTAEQVLNLY